LYDIIKHFLEIGVNLNTHKIEAWVCLGSKNRCPRENFTHQFRVKEIQDLCSGSYMEKGNTMIFE